MASNGEDGVWRTVSGRRIFIREGQDLKEAMKQSGKFSEVRVKNKNKSFKSKKIENNKLKNQINLEKSIEKNPTTKFVDDDDVIDKDTGERLNVSLNDYRDKDGNLTSEREQLHREIIKNYFEGKTPVADGEEKLYYMTGGGAGTGKSRFVADTEKYYGGKDFQMYIAEDGSNLFKGNMIKLDADEIKIKLGLDKNNPNSAGYLHGESSALVKRITEIAQENGYNVMLDGTGDGGIKGMINKIDSAHDRGYKVYANYGTISVEEALERNWNRYIDAKAKGENARLVSGDSVVRTHAKVSQILPELASKFDNVKLWDNSGKNPVLIAEGGNGVDLKVKNSYNKEYLAFLEKEKYNSNDYGNFYDERLKEEDKWIQEKKKKK